MPLAVTHVLITIILLDLFRDFVIKRKQNIPLWMIYVGGVAGLAPDLDIPLFWILYNGFGLSVEWFHRTITHSLVPSLFFLTVAFFLHFKYKRAATITAIIAFGITLHNFIDFLLVGQLMPFYPFSLYSVGLDLLSKTGLHTLAAGLDAVILLGWLFWQEYKHNITDFI